METAQESKVQGWVYPHNALQGHHGYFLGSASRQATWMGLACVALTTTSITYRHEKATTEVQISFSSNCFNFSTLTLTFKF